MTAEYVMKQAKSKWEKKISRKDDISIPEFGEPDKPYKAQYRLLTGKQQGMIKNVSQSFGAGGLKIDTVARDAATIILSLIQPMTGDEIFNMEDHFEFLMKHYDDDDLARISGEIVQGQAEMKTSVEEVKNSSSSVDLTAGGSD